MEVRSTLSRRTGRQISLSFALALATTALSASADAEENLGAQAANPIASMISVPFEQTVDFGAENGSAYILNIQPVIPVKAGSWNLISRPIIPVAHVGGLTAGIPGIPTLPQGIPDTVQVSGATGLGDINYSLFFSPANSGKVTWAVVHRSRLQPRQIPYWGRRSGAQDPLPSLIASLVHIP
jgi:hypothetical protein